MAQWCVCGSVCSELVLGGVCVILTYVHCTGLCTLWCVHCCVLVYYVCVSSLDNVNSLLCVWCYILAVRICGQLVHNSRKWFEISYYGHNLCKLSTCHLRHPSVLLVACIKAGLVRPCVLVYGLGACCTQSGAPALPT